MDESIRLPSPLQVGPTLGEAFRVYRLLFQRSVTTAAVVYAAIALIDLGRHATTGAGSTLLAFVAFVLALAGPLIVQGALVEIVRNVHEGRAPAPIRALVGSSSERFWPLLGASILYAFGVIFAAVLLIVPGLIVAARWSLLAPLVVLERLPVGEARRRSAALVKGQTGAVLGCIVVTFLTIDVIGISLVFAHLGFGTTTFLTFVWSALTAPFQAHVLTVIYYRLADPDRPVVDPAVLRWRSVWDGR